MQNPALFQRRIQGGAGEVSPFGDFLLGDHQHIDANAERPQNVAKADHFGAAVDGPPLDHEKVDIAVRSGVARACQPNNRIVASGAASTRRRAASRMVASDTMTCTVRGHQRVVKLLPGDYLARVVSREQRLCWNRRRAYLQ